MHAAVLYRVRCRESNRTSPSTLRRRSSATPAASGPGRCRSVSASMGMSVPAPPPGDQAGQMPKLRQDQPPYRQTHGVFRARHGDQHHAAVRAGHCTAQHRRRSDSTVTENTEELAEAVEPFIEEARDRFKGRIAGGDAGAAGQEDDTRPLPSRQRPQVRDDAAGLVLQDPVIDDRVAGPAMSRCAHPIPSRTKWLRKSAAVIAPPHRMPVFLKSAMSLLMCSAYSSYIGSGHIGSPALEAAASTSSTSSRLLPRTPAAIGPSATIQAPVSVARAIATSRSGNVDAYDSSSAMTSRPSAYVLPTSTVLPFMIFRTSPGRMAPPPGMFSAIPMRPTTSARGASSGRILMPIFDSSATCRAISAIRCGNSSPAGSLTRSRAKLVALAVVSPNEIPSLTSRRGASPTATWTSRRWLRPERGSER